LAARHARRAGRQRSCRDAAHHAHRRHGVAAAAAARSAAVQRRCVRQGARGHECRVQRRRYGIGLPHRRARHGDGRKDRYGTGARHHQAGTFLRRAEGHGAALAVARPRPVHCLRPGGGAALCPGLHRGARRARPSAGADRPRRAPVRAEARSVEAAHRLSGQCGDGRPAGADRGAWMTTRPYAAARRTLSIADKLYEVNWGMVLLITIVACVGFAMLYSVAGGSFSPWATPQILRFIAGFAILVVVSVVDIRTWLSAAYPIYAGSLLLLIAVVIAGHVGKGAERWITLGPLGLQPSELVKVSLVLALARFLHGKSVEDISRPSNLGLALLMIGIPAVFVVLQPNLGTTLIIVFDGVSLLFLAGLSWWWIAPAMAAVAVAVPTAWQFVLHDYQKRRVL